MSQHNINANTHPPSWWREQERIAAREKEELCEDDPNYGKCLSCGQWLTVDDNDPEFCDDCQGKA